MIYSKKGQAINRTLCYLQAGRGNKVVYQCRGWHIPLQYAIRRMHDQHQFRDGVKAYSPCPGHMDDFGSTPYMRMISEMTGGYWEHRSHPYKAGLYVLGVKQLHTAVSSFHRGISSEIPFSNVDLSLKHNTQVLTADASSSEKVILLLLYVFKGLMLLRSIVVQRVTACLS